VIKINKKIEKILCEIKNIKEDLKKIEPNLIIKRDEYFGYYSNFETNKLPDIKEIDITLQAIYPLHKKFNDLYLKLSLKNKELMEITNLQLFEVNELYKHWLMHQILDNIR